MDYRILKSKNPRTFKNDPTRKEIKNRKKVVIKVQIRKMEEILQYESLESHALIEIARNRGRSISFRLDN